MNSFGERISALISESGITKTSFADKLNITQPYVSGRIDMFFFYIISSNRIFMVSLYKICFKILREIISIKLQNKKPPLRQQKRKMNKRNQLSNTYIQKGRDTMPLPKGKTYTAEDYWNLPDGQRAELIDGQLYDMAPQSFAHQKISLALCRKLADYIDQYKGECAVVPAPFAVNLFKNDKKWLEPDISIICDKNKISDHGCEGAPDFIVEIVSPTSRKMDYSTKNTLYSDAGVREYWIVDPAKERTTVYRYEEDAAPMIVPFDQPIVVGIYGDLQITIADLL